MTTVAYCHPLLPPEWIAAHRLRPRWLQPERSQAGGRGGAVRGACAYAGAVVDAASRDLNAAALVLTTVCDQMRYAAAVIDRHGRQPVFLFHVPSTWQTAVARQMYLEELRRLGRFLVKRGGKAPSGEELIGQMQAFETARAALLAAQDGLSARQLAEELLRLRGDCPSQSQSRVGACTHASNAAIDPCVQAPTLRLPASISAASPPAPLPTNLRSVPGERGVIPLAIVGGPLLAKDFDLFDLVERWGGRVVLDATEGGTRMLPAAFDRARMADDPLAELARAYFAATPDVFRRPNDGLFAWLEQQFAERRVRGVLFWRYVWCDLWHAELYRFRQWSPVPVLEIDVQHDDQGTAARIVGRVEAFLEMLR